MTYIPSRSVPYPAGLKHVISLGVGVQSSTLLFLAEEGKIRPRPTAAVFSDTQAEPASVYSWLQQLLSRKWSFPIYTETHGNLSTDIMKRYISRNTGNRYIRTIIPAYIRNEDGSRGILGRRCTRDYKINVIERTIRQKILNKRIIKASDPMLAVSWIGISTDEADRMKPTNLHWIKNRWPLIELGMSRQDCLDYMAKLGLRPPRSACKFCPYHSDKEWDRLKREEPTEFEAAVQWERDYQREIKEWDEITKGTPFLHNSLVPLDQVQFNVASRIDPMHNECEGMCGV